MNRFKTITEPGKFEGEPGYVLAAWDVVLNGLHDEVGENSEDAPIARVSVDSLPEDTEVPDGAVFIEVWESDYGFVFSDVFCGHHAPDGAWSRPCGEHDGCSMQGKEIS